MLTERTTRAVLVLVCSLVMFGVCAAQEYSPSSLGVSTLSEADTV